jgi:hypothetical protein
LCGGPDDGESESESGEVRPVEARRLEVMKREANSVQESRGSVSDVRAHEKIQNSREDGGPETSYLNMEFILGFV